jgi:uncharacterized protein (DUF305 family)
MRFNPTEEMKDTEEGMMDSGEMDGAAEGKMGEGPFDAMFIDSMIPHHQGAIMMAEECLDTAEHEELRQMALQIIEAQEAEIEQLQQWREEWYPDTPEP